MRQPVFERAANFESFLQLLVELFLIVQCGLRPCRYKRRAR
jgi:hypothetical protein